MKAITHPASAIPYDNTNSGLAADNAQDAIDEIASSSGSSDSVQIPRSLLVFVDSTFKILMDSKARVFSHDSAQGFSVLNSIIVRSNGTLEIEANSRGTVLGV